MPTAQNKKQKIEEAAKKMAASPAFSDFMTLKPEQWAVFLSNIDEQGVEDCLLILKEEADTYDEIEKKAAKRHEVNKTKLLHRLEKVRTEAQLLTRKK